jgi:hypothetical protein
MRPKDNLRPEGDSPFKNVEKTSKFITTQTSKEERIKNSERNQSSISLSDSKTTVTKVDKNAPRHGAILLTTKTVVTVVDNSANGQPRKEGKVHYTKENISNTQQFTNKELKSTTQQTHLRQDTKTSIVERGCEVHQNDNRSNISSTSTFNGSRNNLDKTSKTTTGNTITSGSSTRDYDATKYSQNSEQNFNRKNLMSSSTDVSNSVLYRKEESTNKDLKQSLSTTGAMQRKSISNLADNAFYSNAQDRKSISSTHRQAQGTIGTSSVKNSTSSSNIFNSSTTSNQRQSSTSKHVTSSSVVNSSSSSTQHNVHSTTGTTRYINSASDQQHLHGNSGQNLMSTDNSRSSSNINKQHLTSSNMTGSTSNQQHLHGTTGSSTQNLTSSDNARSSSNTNQQHGMSGTSTQHLTSSNVKGSNSNQQHLYGTTGSSTQNLTSSDNTRSSSNIDQQHGMSGSSTQHLTSSNMTGSTSNQQHSHTTTGSSTQHTMSKKNISSSSTINQQHLHGTSGSDNTGSSSSNNQFFLHGTNGSSNNARQPHGAAGVSSKNLSSSNNLGFHQHLQGMGSASTNIQHLSQGTTGSSKLISSSSNIIDSSTYSRKTSSAFDSKSTSLTSRQSTAKRYGNQSSIILGSGDTPNSSSYRTEYVKSPTGPCLVTKLGSGGDFKHTRSTKSHQFYTPLPKEEKK